MPTVVVAILQAKPGSEAALEAAARTVIEATHLEPGNHLYALHVSTKDPAQFVMVEKWEDEEALGSHFQTPHMAELSGALGDLLAAPPTIIITDPVPAGDPVQGQI